LHGHVGRDRSVGVAPSYRLDGPGTEARWSEVFRARSDWPWGSYSLLHHWYWLFLKAVKRPEGVDHAPHLPPSLKRVELYTPALCLYDRLTLLLT
jgi:hypothetical protein